jgi:dipeptidase
MNKLKVFLVLFFLVAVFNYSYSCTNYLITKGASKDGSTMITYAADSHQLFGALYFWPAMDWAAGSMLDIYEWDTGKYKGQIPQVAHTYNVVGNMNENQVAIGETTYGGLESLWTQEGAIIDYGSLIYITLQRSTSARDAIRIMSELVSTYGYASEGESFSISDKDEVWIVEMIGKGEGEKGAVWVALLIPDGYVCGHANQARITNFEFQKTNDFTSKTQTVYNSSDVISFAVRKGLYEGKDKDFSFSDVYAPVDFGGARFCDMRVWTFFNEVSKEFSANSSYWNYVKGNVEHKKVYESGPYTVENFATNRLPLWIKPDEKIDVHSVMNYMRNHLEGTELDMSKDFGAEPYGLPYRWRPMTWEVDGQEYVHERTNSTQQTGFSFVTQSRSWMPDALGGIIWFGVDDASSSVYTPVYTSSTEIPETYALGNGSMIEWSDNCAFWIFNQVCNLAYTRYNVIHPEIDSIQQATEEKYIKYIGVVDNAAITLYETDKELGIEFITNFSVNTANDLVADWQELYHYLFMKYMDGNVKDSKDLHLLDNGSGKGIPTLTQPGYSEEWYKRIVDETGDKLKVTGSSH